jgi:hypothetical protein
MTEEQNSKTTDQTKSQQQIKNHWENFIKFFWPIFILKTILKLFTYAEISKTAYSIFVFAQFIPVLLMVYLMAYYTYKITKKKPFLLTGLLGFFWFGIIGIFVGFFLIKRIKDVELGKLNPTKSSQQYEAHN